MILSQLQALQLVLEPIDPVIKTNVQLQDDHKVHIQGVGYEDVLNEVIGYENVEQFKLKKILTQPFTRPVFKKIIKSQSRWKTARGTQKYYKFRTDSEKYGKDFSENVLSKVWKGSSINKFVKDFLSKAIYEEFNGFLLVERGRIVSDDEGNYYEIQNGVRKAIKNPAEKLIPYICFMSAEEVYKFKVTGEKVEFIIFDFGEEERKINGVDTKVKLYRVIDDKYDYIIEKIDGKVFMSTEYKTIEHKAGQCPVSCISFINQKLTCDATRTSPVDEIIKLLDYYLHQFAEKLVTEVLHAHPIFWQIGTKCSAVGEHGIKCNSGWIVGEYGGQSIKHQCKSCNGTGHNLKKDASTVIILPAKDADGKTTSVTSAAGYVTTDVDILVHQEKSIDWMENKILESALGTREVVGQNMQNKTATEAMINIKPLQDIINEIIDIIESVETNLTNIIGKMYYGDLYVGCEIINGRQLSIKDENTIMLEQKAAKESGVSNSIIRSLSEELVYSKFEYSPIERQRNILFLNIEPLVGFTASEVQSNTSVPENIKILKVNFNDFIVKFENDNGDILEYKKDIDQRKKIEDIISILIGYADVYLSTINDTKKAQAELNKTSVIAK